MLLLVWQQAIHEVYTSSRHARVNQEIGSASEASRRFSLPDGHSDKLTTEHIAQYGFFSQFNYSQLYAPIMDGHELKPNGPDRSDVDNLMSQKEPLWQLLASAIPARSFAVAANALTSLVKRNGDNYNIKMHLMRDKNKEEKPYWPSERKDENKTDYDWLHSDVRDMALPYVHQVYGKMLDEGRLRKKQ